MKVKQKIEVEWNWRKEKKDVEEKRKSIEDKERVKYILLMIY